MTTIAMNSKPRWLERISIRLLIILAVFLVAGTLAGWVAMSFGGVKLPWIGLAFSACVISSLVAHVFGEYPSGDEKFMARLGGSMAARTALPFLVVIYAQVTSSVPLQTGFVLLVVVFYLVGLVADVSLQVLRTKTAN